MPHGPHLEPELVVEDRHLSRGDPEVERGHRAGGVLVVVRVLDQLEHAVTIARVQLLVGRSQPAVLAALELLTQVKCKPFLALELTQPSTFDPCGMYSL